MLVGSVDVASCLDSVGRSDMKKLHDLADGVNPTKGPMGPLLKQLRKILSQHASPTGALDSLADLIKERNRLAHDYLLEERDTVEDLRAAICELRALRRRFLLMGAALMHGNVESLTTVGESLLAIREAEREMWVRTVAMHTADGSIRRRTRHAGQ